MFPYRRTRNTYLITQISIRTGIKSLYNMIGLGITEGLPRLMDRGTLNDEVASLCWALQGGGELGKKSVLLFSIPFLFL